MRAINASSLFGLGTLFFLVLAGCPPSLFDPCRGFECGPFGDDDGGSHEAGRDREEPPPPAPDAPTITRVTVEGNPSRTIRQGFGGTTTVHLAGERLGDISEVTLGDVPSALRGDITAKSPTELVFTVTIRHGAPIGLHAVKATALSGASATFADALSITAITASPEGSDLLDTTLDSTGTTEHPLRSLAKATTLAGAGDTVFLKDGIYDVQNGETFSNGDPNVPPDVTIKGESKEHTLLQGAETGCSPSTALVLAGSARIEALGIARFCDAGIVSGTSGSVTIKAVAIRGGTRGVGAWTNVTLDLVDISGTTLAVDFGSAEGTLTVINSHVYGNGSGIDAQYAEGPLVVTRSEIDHNGPGTMSRVDGAIIVRGPATLTDVSVHDNRCVGVLIPVVLSGPLIINKGFFANNSFVGIGIEGPGKTIIRDASFGYHEKTIHFGTEAGAADLDLGTRESPGHNIFTTCDTCDTIVDERAAPTQGVSPITVTGNKWYQGGYEKMIPEGCSDTDEPKGSTAPPRVWHIEHPGNCRAPSGNVILN